MKKKKKTIKAIFDAYKKLDDATKGWVFNNQSPYPVNIYGLSKLIMLFNNTQNKQGLFFTLNQDLFMERRFGYMCPGAPKFQQDFYSLSKDLSHNEFVSLPVDNVEKLVANDLCSHAGFAYIKLHGSYGWKSSNGLNQLVIGKNKINSISSEPLLKCYFDIFQTAIQQGSKKLLIIGYGFQDQHINQILLDGVEKYNLKLYIVGQSPRSVKERIENGHYYAKGILDGVGGYFPYALKEIFPANQEETVYFKDIKNALINTY